MKKVTKPILYFAGFVVLLIVGLIISTSTQTKTESETVIQETIQPKAEPKSEPTTEEDYQTFLMREFKDNFIKVCNIEANMEAYCDCVYENLYNKVGNSIIDEAKHYEETGEFSDKIIDALMESINDCVYLTN